MSKIAIYLDRKFNRGVPHADLSRLKWFLYNVYVEEIPKKVHNEISNVVLLLKKFFISMAAEDRWINWNNIIHFAQLMSHVKRAIMQRKHLHLSIEFLQELLEFLVNDFKDIYA